MLVTVEGLAGYFRKASLWPATFGLACCAIEMMTSGGPRYDLARFGMEVFRASPRQADLMIVAGRVSQKMAPVLRQIYDQMPNPKWVLAMGVCASSGGMFNNYAIVQGVDHVVPVDMYLPGCPPRPEMLIDAILKLHDDIQTAKLGSPTASPRSRATSRPPSTASTDVRHDGPAAMSDDEARTRSSVPPAGQPAGGPEKPVGERSLEDKPAEEVSIADKSLSDDDLDRQRRPGSAAAAGPRRRRRTPRHVRRRAAPVTRPATAAWSGRWRSLARPHGPYGGWFDAVADRLDEVLGPTAPPTPSPRSSCIAARSRSTSRASTSSR